MTPLPTLFNGTLFGTHLFNGNNIESAFSTDLAVFDGFSLNDENGYMICSGLHDPPATRELSGDDIPRGHGMFLNGAWYRKGKIVLKGTLIRDSAANFKTYMDTVKKNLSGTQKFLDITENGVVRRYVATLSNPESLFPMREHYNVTWLPWTAQFECRSPFASDRNYTTSSLVLTDASQNLSFVQAGSAPSECVVVCIVGSATDVDTITVQRIDPADGLVKEEIEYTGTVTAGDVFVFDGEQKKVFKNSVEVGYLGGHLTLPVASHLIKVTPSGVGTPVFSMSVTAKRKNKYL
jgi:hypothetical protein